MKKYIIALLIAVMVVVLLHHFMNLIYGRKIAQQAKPIESPQIRVDQNAGASNAALASTFFANNRSNPGIVTLASGLQYKVLQVGSGKQPSLNDTVVVDYEGRLLNGQIFDSSYTRGKPAVLPLSSVIPGWQEAMQLMHVGATWELYIPAELAYGSAGYPPVIGSNEALIFKVHLREIK